VAWFQKVLGLGKKENTVLTLKLRLNRWRHFLRAEWACHRLLDDLKEKSQGEYIFDSQYIFSTVSRIFQQAYQAAYDGTLLDPGLAGGLYLQLDQLKEEAMSFLSGYPRGRPIPEPGVGGRNPLSESLVEGGPDVESLDRDVEGLDLDREPEFQMLKGVIKILDSDAGKQGPLPSEKSEGGPLRTVLRWTHEQVLGQLINQEEIRQWLSAGPAVSWGNQKTGSFNLIDLEKETYRGRDHLKETGGQGKESFSFQAWPLVEEALSALSRKWLEDTGAVPRTFFGILNENALFLSGSSMGTRFFLDLILTHVRELNHFFFRIQRDSDGGPDLIKIISSWDWTYQKDGRVFEFSAYQKPAKEIEGYITQLGHHLGFE
jgi:hypothetical protein